jgi:glycosyltransferase involved in cell wall biosynthesis
VLVVNEWSQRKGYPEAFAAIAGLADLGLPHALRVAGHIAPEKAAQISVLRAAAPRPDRVELLGYVPDLPALYQAASVFIGTSRYEGFGLPALEAMACGTPVVAFDNSATTEIVAGGGVLVPDGDVAALVGAVHRIIEEPSWAAEMSERGLARAAEFSWAKSAALHAEIIRSVA